MFNRYTRLRIRRSLRRKQRTIEAASQEAGEQFDEHVIKRLDNLISVRRFVVGWLALVALLIGGVYLQARELRPFYQSEVPIAGGTLREGIVGQITNMNPIFATSTADRSASKLQFSTLFKYDAKNQLVPDLASGWQLSDDKTIYTVKLRDDIMWHDGERFDADDVVFTFDAIQHPDSRSFLFASWQDITVQAKDDYTVTFALPNPYTPFLDSLTIGGMIPEHILGEVEPTLLRGHPFNVSEPVGTGPFMFEEIATSPNDTTVLRMTASDSYHAGRPRLDRYVIRTYTDNEPLFSDIREGVIAAAAGLPSSFQQEILSNPDAVWRDIQLSNGVYVFLNTKKDYLSEGAVRKALARSTDQVAILNTLNAGAIAVKGPLLSSHLGYNPDLVQVGYDVTAAKKLLDDAGWKLEEDGIRYKDDEPLSFQLVTQNSDEFVSVAELIKKQWAEIGVDLDVLVVEESTIQQDHIVAHNYDSLLFGITIGNDPDVFLYWHSSQSGVNGFNLSEYRSDTADTALEAGRTRDDPEVRAAKYETFLRRWRIDSPAIGLYQPGYSFVLRDNVSNFDVDQAVSPEYRYADVHLWRIDTRAAER